MASYLTTIQASVRTGIPKTKLARWRRDDFRYVEGRSHFDLYTVGDDRSGLYKAIAWEMYPPF